MTTSTDGLVQRLRAYQPYFLNGSAFGPKVCIQAADRIEAQAARIAELEGALEELVERVSADGIERARTALRGGTQP